MKIKNLDKLYKDDPKKLHSLLVEDFEESDADIYDLPKAEGTCPHCDGPLQFVGYQGNLEEFKCPECDEYYYFDENGNEVTESLNEAANDYPTDTNKLKARLREINKAIENGEDPEYFAYEKKKIFDQLDSLGSNYYDESLDESKIQEYEYTLYNAFSKNSFHKKVKCSSKEEAKKIADDELKKLQKNGHFKDLVVKDVKEIQESLDEAKNDTLNPAIWDENNELKPEVKKKLIYIADVFIDKLLKDDVPLDVEDVIIVGSNANYNYTPYSDIDLHIVADTSDFKGREKELVEKIYQCKKAMFNDRYDPVINGFNVELYIEPADDRNNNEIPDEIEEPVEEPNGEEEVFEV